MKKIMIGLSVGGLMILLVATALAFSFSLQVLNVNAASFAIPSSSAVLGAPMTSDAESQIEAPASQTVRFQTTQEPEHLCHRGEGTNSTDSSAGF